MKLFNWVHRKFQQNADSYSVCPKKEGKLPLEETKHEIYTNNSHDKEVLLDNVTLVEVLDGWKDGILTIGTFGFDPLKENEEFSPDNNKEYVQEEEEENSAEKNKGMLNPVVVKAFEIEFLKEMGSNLDASVPRLDHLTPTVEDAPLLKFIESPEIKADEVETDKKKRTTLADLFSADSVDGAMEKSGLDEEKSESNNKSSATKTGHSFGKKLMPPKGETRVIKKLHKMVTKMLKKKIHPDLESKQVRGNKEGSIANESTVEMMNCNGVSAAQCIQDSSQVTGRVELISLLSTQTSV
ncbi:uncharacterized protein LOC113292748 [Papaver somniferum]|uniref:uncharacterized protein LOC113292748 n=1 Tax=Papaver somniferum TaxID=3469 RepID=UPI000E6FE97F|nr:uncharacterized protein LOC113292748 [Papaver somniferum]